MNKLATIEIISKIDPNPGADRIMIASVLGYQSVIVKDSFKEGDLIIFVHTDTTIKYQEWNKFLFKKDSDITKPLRIKNQKLRGQISQGVIFPLSIIKIDSPLLAGVDVAEVIGVEKYEAPLALELAGKAEGGYYPNRYGLSATDEENCQSSPDLLKEFNGLEVYASLKADGSSGSFIWTGINPWHGTPSGGEFKVCSRRLTLLEDKEQGRESLNTFWYIANKYNLKEKLSKAGIDGYIIRGEVCSPRIQKNRLGLTEPELFVFDFFVIHYLDGKVQQNGYENLKETCNKLGLKTVKTIPLEGKETFIFDEKIHTLEYFQKIANELKYDNGQPAEGLVLRPISSTYSRSLGRNLSCKFISQNYNQD